MGTILVPYHLNCDYLLMPVYKKILSLLLLLLAAAPLIIFTTYTINQKIVQLQMQEALEQKNVQTITIAKNALQWVDAGKEIIVHGKLFDVKSYKSLGDKIILTGLFDSEETAIKNQVDKLQQQKNKSKTPLDNLVLKFLFSSAILPSKLCLPIFIYTNKNIYCNYTCALKLQEITIISPPPNV